MSISYSDPQSPYQLNFVNPRRRSQVLALAQKYVAYEQTLPAEQQTPHTSKIIDLLQQLTTAHNNRLEAERQRSIASDELKRIEKQVPSLIKQLWKTVTVHHPDQPSTATNWGFKMKGSTRNVLLPKTRNERRATLATYIKREESRSEAERFRVPDLAEVIKVRDAWEYNLAMREKATNQRESNVEACNELTQRLSLYLQAACIYLLAETFDFKLSNKLQNWGFNVVLKRSESSTSFVSEAEAATTTTTNGNGSVNGSVEEVLDVERGT